MHVTRKVTMEKLIKEEKIICKINRNRMTIRVGQAVTERTMMTMMMKIIVKKMIAMTITSMTGTKMTRTMIAIK